MADCQWKQDWDSKDLSEAQVRDYLKNFFDSEIPRLFWPVHGDLSRQAPPRGRRQHFPGLVEAEYLRAIRTGPPARKREQKSATGKARSRRQQIVDADHINGRSSVP